MARSSERQDRLYYPISLDIRGKKCLVIGGGAVAARKARALAQCAARVVVVAPQISKPLQTLARKGLVAVRPRRFSPPDLRGAFLAIAATDDPAVNRAVACAARRNRIPVNVVDLPEYCDFQVPAVLRRGPVAVAVSTGGASPALAAKLRDMIAETIGPEFARAARETARLRAFVKQTVTRKRERMRISSALARQALQRARRLPPKD